MTATERLLFFIRSNGNPSSACVGSDLYQAASNEAHANFIQQIGVGGTSLKLMNTIFVLDESLNPNQVIIKEQ